MTLLKQSSMRLPSLKPPSGVHNWDFSLNRKNLMFRWRLSDDEWHCKRVAGDVRVLHADGERGHLILRGYLSIADSGTAQVYSPPEEDPIWNYDPSLMDLDEDSYNEWICSLEGPVCGPSLTGDGVAVGPSEGWVPGQQAVEDGITFIYDESVYDYSDFPEEGFHTNWRLCYFRAGREWRLRDERTGRLYLVKDYRGTIKINWFDGGTHVFHNGLVTLDKKSRIAVFHG